MKYILAALLALAGVLQAAVDVKSLSIANRTGGDAGFTAVVNPDNQEIKLRFTIDEVPPTASPVNVQSDTNVPVSTEDQSRPFNVTGLPGGKTYEAKVEARLRSAADDSPALDSESVSFTVDAYSKITLKTPVLTPATKDESPTAKLTATVVPSPGTASVIVKFEYGPRSGIYEEEAAAEQVGTTTDYTATVPESDEDDLERGVTYHYRVSVTTEGSASPSTSENSTFTTPANRAPNARADTFRLRGDRAVTIDVLMNDRDPDGDDISLISVTQGSQGSVAIVNGQVRYTPRPDANGNDTFTYTIRDDYDNPDTTADERQFATGSVTINAPGLESRGLHTAELKDADGNVVGLIRLYGTGGGSVSGKVHLFTKTYTVQGEIGADGAFHYTIPREGEDPLQLEVDFENEGEGVFDVSIGTLEETWTGEAVPYTITDARRDELVGKYTVEFPAAGGDGLPQGIGYAQVDVRPWGEVSAKGHLGDGTKFSTKAILGGSDESPIVTIWATPRNSRLSLTLNLGADSTASLSGPMKWYRAPDRNADFFPDGFYTELSAAGSRFTPAEKNRSLNDAKLATLTLSNGNITSNIIVQLEISKSDRVNFLNPNPYGVTLKINSDNGTFKGEFDHPFDDSRRKFNGVLLQTQGKASGVFTGINQTGSVALSIGITTPPPTTPTTPTNPTTPTIPSGDPGTDGDFGFNF